MKRAVNRQQRRRRRERTVTGEAAQKGNRRERETERSFA